MAEREERRARWERRLQSAVFVGALLILAGMLFAAVVAQRARRERERPAVPPSPTPAPTFSPAYPAPERRPAYPLPADLFPVVPQDDGSWSYKTGEPLDPARVRSDGAELSALFLGLIRRGSSAPWVQPTLAASWTASEDGLTYTFRLRRDVYWVRCDLQTRQVQRLRPVGAADVASAIARSLDPHLRDVPQRELLLPIVGAPERLQGAAAAALGVTALDEFTLQVRLTRPTPDLPARLFYPVAWPVPREWAAGEWAWWQDLGRAWVNGPFCPVAWDAASGRLTLVPNPFFPAGLLTLSLPRGALAPPASYP